METVSRESCVCRFFRSLYWTDVSILIWRYDDLGEKMNRTANASDVSVEILTERLEGILGLRTARRAEVPGNIPHA